jgi:hypothetical protein
LNTARSTDPWPSICGPRLRKVIQSVKYEEMKGQEVKKRIHNGMFDQTEMQSLGRTRIPSANQRMLAGFRSDIGRCLDFGVIWVTDTCCAHAASRPPINEHPTVAQSRGSSPGLRMASFSLVGYVLCCLEVQGSPSSASGCCPDSNHSPFVVSTLLSWYLVFSLSFLFLFLYLVYRNASKANWLEKRNTASSSRLLTPILSSLYAKLAKLLNSSPFPYVSPQHIFSPHRERPTPSRIRCRCSPRMMHSGALLTTQPRLADP